MRFTRYFLVLVFLLISSTGTLFARDGEALKATVIYIPPYDAFYSEFLEAASQRSGIPIEINVRPYRRKLADLAAGRSDIAVSIDGPDMEEVATSLFDLFTLRFIVVGWKGDDIMQPQDLMDKTLGLLRQSAFITDVKDFDKIRISRANSYDNIINMFSGERVERIGGAEPSLRFHFEEAGIQPSDLGKPYVLDTRYIQLVSSRKSSRSADIEAFSAAARALLEEGAFKEIGRKHGILIDRTEGTHSAR